MVNKSIRSILIAVVGISAVLAAAPAFAQTGPDTWGTRANFPTSANYGAALAYPGTGNHIYAFGGGGSEVFRRYDIVADTWSNLATYPYSNTTWGMAMCSTQDDFLWACGGQNVFYRYTISTNTWTVRTAPGWSHFQEGGRLVYPGSGDFIYLLRGADSNTFSRYSISTNSWTLRATSPGFGGNGCSLVWGGGNFLYAVEADNTTNFWRYDMVNNLWTTRSPTPATMTAGASLTWPQAGSSDYIYATRVENTTTFYRYQISTDTWTTMANTPGIMGRGCIGVWVSLGAGEFLYYLQTEGTGFWRYQHMSPGSPPAQPTATSPANGFMYVNDTTADLACSAFSDPDTGSPTTGAGGLHAFSEWETRPIGGTFGGTNSTSSGLSAAALLAWTTPALIDGTHSWRVRHQDSWGSWSPWSAESTFIIETTPPNAGSVSHTGTRTSITGTWSGFSDAESGIADYEWAIGTAPGAQDVQAFTSVGLATSAINPTVLLIDGQLYYVTVRATNGAGMQTTVNGPGVVLGSPGSDNRNCSATNASAGFGSSAAIPVLLMIFALFLRRRS